MFEPIRGFTSLKRTPQADLKLGTVLAFVAGATNAGGFLAVGQYTSHMTGMVSAMADNLVLGQFVLAGAALAAVLAFLIGAMSTAWLVNWGMRLQLRSAYGLPLLIEAVLLLVFGIFGAAMSLWHTVFLPVTVVLLCYIMGLQNAVITKISQARIRTTHLTGMVTDMGIELGKFAYLGIARLLSHPPVPVDGRKLAILLPIIFMFFFGGLVGALGFKHLGHAFALPIAALLLAVASPQLLPRPTDGR